MRPPLAGVFIATGRNWLISAVPAQQLLYSCLMSRPKLMYACTAWLKRHLN